MIGRAGPVNPLELQRWAREQAAIKYVVADEGGAETETKLSLLEAHVLLLLATYADKQAIAYPSIKTLAERSGLDVRERHRRHPKTGKPTVSHENRAITAALARLVELQLVWPKRHGRSATRYELLFDPHAGAGRVDPHDNAGQGVDPHDNAGRRDFDPHDNAGQGVDPHDNAGPVDPHQGAGEGTKQRNQGTSTPRTSRKGPDDDPHHGAGRAESPISRENTGRRRLRPIADVLDFEELRRQAEFDPGRKATA